MDAFFFRHPPVDLLVAAYLGFKGPEEKKTKPSAKQIARMNGEYLRTIPTPRNLKNLSEMPAFLQTPEKLEAIRKMREELARNAGQ